ncbi:MAG: hypothetical protein RLZ98_3762 [Pseudomonadota bacterium]|jgi:hypothetical protein
MAKIEPRRMAAQIEGDFVVFLIGMRINSLRRVSRWVPVVRAMAGMMRELERNPELGLLHARHHAGLRNHMVVQYWRSFEHLHAYATDFTHAHFPAWKAFNQAARENDHVGIWHETYLVPNGHYEAIYRAMPAWGLGRAGRLVEATGLRKSAKGRLGRGSGADQPVDV